MALPYSLLKETASVTTQQLKKITLVWPNQISVQAKKSKYLNHSQVNFSPNRFPIHVDTKSHV